MHLGNEVVKPHFSAFWYILWYPYSLHIIDFVCVNFWPQLHSGKVSGSRSKGAGFNSSSGHI